MNYTDVETSQSTVLCNRIECEHDNDSCTGFIDAFSVRLFMNPKKDKLFYIIKENVAKLGSTIVKMDINGENREELFSTDDWEEPLYVLTGNDDYLFFLTHQIVDEQIMFTLYQLNYHNGNSSILLETKENISLVSAYDELLILETLTNVPEGNHISISSFNVNTKEKLEIDSYTKIETPYEVDDFDNQEKMSYVSGNFLFVFERNSPNTAKLIQQNLKTGEQKLITESASFVGAVNNSSITGYYDGYLTTILYSPEDKLSYLEIIDTNDGTVYTNTLSQKAPDSIDRNNNIVKPEHRAVYIMDQVQNKFIVHVGYETLTTLDGTKSGGRLIVSIDKKDMLNNIENYTEVDFG